MVIENNSDSDISAWKLDFEGEWTIDNLWNGKLLSNKNYRFSVKGAENNGTIYAGDSVSFNFTSTIEISLSEDEEEALKAVNASFSIYKRRLDSITVQEGFVSFCAYQYPVSIIYSFNDIKPNFIRYSGEKIEYSLLFNVVKLTDHWYFACN